MIESLPMSVRRSDGFALLTSIGLTILILLLVLLVQLQSANHWKLVSGFESQLHSLVLAENDVEYARTILPLLDIHQLLVGQNGVHEGDRQPEWRNPLPFSLPGNSIRAVSCPATMMEFPFIKGAALCCPDTAQKTEAISSCAFPTIPRSQRSRTRTMSCWFAPPGSSPVTSGVLSPPICETM